MPDGGVAVATWDGKAYTIAAISSTGELGRTASGDGRILSLVSSSEGIAYGLGEGGLNVPTTARALKRCSTSTHDRFIVGWRPDSGTIGFSTFLDGGVSAMTTAGERLVLTAPTDVQVLDAAAVDEQRACLSSRARNYGTSPISDNPIATPVAPGEFLWLHGSGIGPSTEVRIQMDGVRTEAPRELEGTRVLFDGVPAVVLAVSDHRVLAQVPYAVAGRSETAVQVQHHDQVTNEVMFDVRDAVPAAIAGGVYNEDWSQNSQSNPAAPGEVVSVFVSGAGRLQGVVDDALAVREPIPGLAQPIRAFISGSGGQEVTFAGGVAGQLPGLVQVNVRIGADFAFHGRMTLLLSAGDSEAMVELWVR
jgi:uncharacterized protein (TIGR03437 family)